MSGANHVSTCRVLNLIELYVKYPPVWGVLFPVTYLFELMTSCTAKSHYFSNWAQTAPHAPLIPVLFLPRAAGLSTCPSVRVSCLSVRVSWTGLSSVRLALGLPQGKLRVTLAYMADTSHSKLAPRMHEHTPRLTRRRARRRLHAYVVVRSGIHAHTSLRAQEFARIRRRAL